MKKTSIGDVAKKAGVSTATVSHVINNTRFVTPETREKVLSAIRELGYSPNETARSLKTGKTNKIMFIVPDIGNQYFTTIIESVENTLSEHNYQLIIANTHEDWKREMKHLDSCNRSSADGLLIATTQTDWKVLKKHLPDDMPIVLIDRRLDQSTSCCAWISAYDAVYQAVMELGQQHEKIGFIAGIPSLSTSIERYRAYLDAVFAMNLKPYIEQGNSLRNSSPSCYQRLVNKGCTAVVAANGMMTEDIVFSRSISTDDNVTLVGFRESPNMHPLTQLSILQPSDELGKMAAERIYSLITDSSDPDPDLAKDIRLLAKFEKQR